MSLTAAKCLARGCGHLYYALHIIIIIVNTWSVFGVVGGLTLRREFDLTLNVMEVGPGAIAEIRDSGASSEANIGQLVLLLAVLLL